MPFSVSLQSYILGIMSCTFYDCLLLITLKVKRCQLYMTGAGRDVFIRDTLMFLLQHMLLVTSKCMEASETTALSAVMFTAL
jgi:hypothetical protein